MPYAPSGTHHDSIEAAQQMAPFGDRTSEWGNTSSEENSSPKLRKTYDTAEYAA